MSHAVLDRPCTEVSPALEQVICIHPHAEKTDSLYWFDAQIAHKDRAERLQVLVISPNTSLAAINRAIWAELGSRWFCTRFQVAA